MINWQNKKRVTDHMEQNPSLEANRSSSRQETLYNLRNTNVHYRFHKSLLFFRHEPCELRPCFPIPFLLRYVLLLCFYQCLSLSSGFLFQAFNFNGLQFIFFALPCIPRVLPMLASFISIAIIASGQQYNSRGSSWRNFPPCCHLIPLRSKRASERHVLELLYPMSFP